MKKDARIDLRTQSATKAQWEQWADDLGYGKGGLSKLIEDAVPDFAQRELAKDSDVVAEVPGIPVVETKRATGLEEGKGQEQLTAVPTPPSHPKAGECPNKAKHRKGIYCKGCRKVVS